MIIEGRNAPGDVKIRALDCLAKHIGFYAIDNSQRCISDCFAELKEFKVISLDAATISEMTKLATSGTEDLEARVKALDTLARGSGYYSKHIRQLIGSANALNR